MGIHSADAPGSGDARRGLIPMPIANNVVLGANVQIHHPSLVNLYGLPDAKFGNPNYCTGPLANLA